jgi:hypothetical protein
MRVNNKTYISKIKNYVIESYMTNPVRYVAIWCVYYDSTRRLVANLRDANPTEEEINIMLESLQSLVKNNE